MKVEAKGLEYGRALQLEDLARPDRFQIATIHLF
jgi:hypothetical protein